MDLNEQKQQFSIAYLRAVVAVAGYNLYKLDVDDDSVDCGIAARASADTPRRPRVEAQLKCSARSILHEDAVHFPLKIKNYDELREEDLLVPRILVVVLVPENVADWTRQSEEELALRYCGYWLSLRGKPPVQNTETATVRLPRLQRFSWEALQQIMRQINDEGRP